LKPEHRILLRPPDARAILVFAHGAGAGMRHPFMEATANDLADRGVATLRFQFPYMAEGRRAPDRPPRLVASVREACAAALVEAPDLPLFAGGKSMGGRMTSTAVAEDAIEALQGLVFLGFPLHRPGDPSDARADHLSAVTLPMLFVQGTRDRLAELGRIRRICAAIGDRAALHVVEGADHGFEILKRSGRTEAEVRDELSGAVSEWISGRLTTAPTVE
jgi:predicted alpha/beta-hydrolase family hydrolase